MKPKTDPTMSQAAADADHPVIHVEGGFGAAMNVPAGHLIKIVNTHGTQVVDFWAHSATDTDEFLGLGQCREVLGQIYFRTGDTLISNRYRPILTVASDDTGINHDTLIAPCSAPMYQYVGAEVTHRSCTSNYHDALKSRDEGDPPQPWNLFMTAAVDPSGKIEYARPPVQPGMTIELKAEMDLIVVVSACPDDHYPTNGGDGTPRSVTVEIRCAS